MKEFRAVRFEDLRFPSGGVLANVLPVRRTVDEALARYAAARPAVVFSSAFLEGNPITLAQVEALLTGVALGGVDQDDVDQALALADAAQMVASWVQTQTPVLSFERGDELNAVLVRHEAIEAGVRRAASSVNPDGRGASVNVMGDTFVGMRKDELRRIEPVFLEKVAGVEHPVLRAVTLAAAGAYCQFYFDGNKRTFRFMADAELLSRGYDAIVIPPSRADEYQQALAQIFRTGDTTPYVIFLLDVAGRHELVA